MLVTVASTRYSVLAICQTGISLPNAMRVNEVVDYPVLILLWSDPTISPQAEVRSLPGVLISDTPLPCVWLVSGPLWLPVCLEPVSQFDGTHDLHLSFVTDS